jgi:arabinofuranosyltransferase
VGHLERQLPAGYLESIKQNRNLIEDKELSALYEKLRLITRGEIFDMQRWKIIWELNFM